MYKTETQVIIEHKEIGKQVVTKDVRIMAEYKSSRKFNIVQEISEENKKVIK